MKSDHPSSPRCAGVLLSLALAACGSAIAQDYPNRPVKRGRTSLSVESDISGTALRNPATRSDTYSKRHLNRFEPPGRDALGDNQTWEITDECPS